MGGSQCSASSTSSGFEENFEDLACHTERFKASLSSERAKLHLWFLMLSHPLVSYTFWKITECRSDCSDFQLGILSSNSYRITISFNSPEVVSNVSVCFSLPVWVATWCGPAPLWASWGAAGPFCTAAWTARCYDPCSIPWGTPKTEGEREEWIS